MNYAQGQLYFFLRCIVDLLEHNWENWPPLILQESWITTVQYVNSAQTRVFWPNQIYLLFITKITFILHWNAAACTHSGMKTGWSRPCSLSMDFFFNIDTQCQLIYTAFLFCFLTIYPLCDSRRRVFENRVLRKIFWTEEGWSDRGGENCTTRSFMMCSLCQV
jgi:hypothetical protein